MRRLYTKDNDLVGQHLQGLGQQQCLPQTSRVHRKRFVISQKACLVKGKTDEFTHGSAYIGSIDHDHQLLPFHQVD
jgi:hypothetical protein